MEYALLGTLYAIALWDTCQCVLLFGSTVIVVNKMLYALGFCCAVRLLGACTLQIFRNRVRLYAYLGLYDYWHSIVFSLFFCKIVHLWGISFPQHFVPKDPDFFFTCNISLVFKIVLKDWNESEGNFNLAQAILKFPEDSFQSWRTILKTREMLQVKKSLGL